MIELTLATRKQVIDDDIIAELERIVQDCKDGKVTEIIVVCNEPCIGAYSKMCGFEDFVRALGALEYAKTSILKAKGIID